MLEMDLIGWVVICLCAFMIGVSKTGVPGIGILAVPLIAMVLPARYSVGILLGILVLADLFAAGYYRRHAQWNHIVRLLPAAFAGIIAGYFGLKVINDDQLQPVIGAVVLVMLGINYWRSRKEDVQIPNHWCFAVCLGFLAGVTSMMANAAGPIMIVYLIAMRLPKIEFIGTAAWFFFAINWLKVPFGVNLQMVTMESIKLDLMMLPAIAAGAVFGIFVLKRIPQKWFTTVVEILAVAAAVKLLF